MSRLDGKIALVTGGSRGIGAAIAKKLAADGANVAITYSKSPGPAEEVIAGIERQGRRAIAIAADAGAPVAVEAAVGKTVSEFGRIDILVNNAGIFHIGPLEEYSPEDFDRTIAVNVRSAFFATQAAAKHMGEGGRVISIGSVVADSVPWPQLTLYALSKAALVGMTKGLARDLGARGITVNVVQPGPIDTDMNPADGAFADTMRAATAAGRYGKPQEVADLVAWLAGPESAYVTGASFTIDGGFTA